MGICFKLNGRPVDVSTTPTLTLLNWLRAQGQTGSKEGCAEGDCGACTVLMKEAPTPQSPGRFRAVNSCLLLMPMVEGRELWTIEGLAQGKELHPVQQAMLPMGSQCGYCTPGFVMTLAEACYRNDLDQPWKLQDQLCGNLCRCTGYRPIREAAEQIAGLCPKDALSQSLQTPADPPKALHLSGEQRWWGPLNLAGVWAALQEAPTARFVTGGTDLGLDVTKKFVAFPALIGLDRVEELHGITPLPHGTRIGAAETLSDIEDWSADGCPVLHRMLRYFAGRQIKHRATIGGNLCNASPIGDLAPVMLALNATLIVASAQGQRRVSIDDWFTGYRKTALMPGELLCAIEIPHLPAQTRIGAYKLSRRRELDISTVAGGFRIETDENNIVTLACFAFGGMAATPIRCRDAEAAVLGQPWTESTAEAAAKATFLNLNPVSDIRGSVWFRLTLAGNLIRGFFEETRLNPFVPLPNSHTGTLLLETTP